MNDTKYEDALRALAQAALQHAQQLLYDDDNDRAQCGDDWRVADELLDEVIRDFCDDLYVAAQSIRAAHAHELHCSAQHGILPAN